MPIYEEDKLDGKIEEAVHEVFPFTSTKYEFYRCPNWVKTLLFHSNRLTKVHEIIKLFNTSIYNPSDRNAQQPVHQRSSNIIIHDLMIKPMSNYEFDKYNKAWQDEPGSIEITLSEVSGDNILREQKMKIDATTQIGVFKSYLLTYLNNKMFFLDISIDNSCLLKDLLTRLKNGNVIRLYTDLVHFNLKVVDMFPLSDLSVPGFNV